MASFKNPVSGFLGGLGRVVRDSVSDSAAPMWMGATVLFAALFFLSAIFNLKIHVSFGDVTTTTGTYQTAYPAVQQAAPAGGIASQVGGC